MAQLVTPGITLINTMTNTILGPEEVVAKYGVPPELIIDFLALMGTFDNIPACRGWVKKLHRPFCRDWGGLDTLYAESDKIAGLTFRGAKTMATKLEDNKEVAYLSYQLATSKLTLSLSWAVNSLKCSNSADLLNLFKQYELADHRRRKRQVAAGQRGKPTAKPKETVVVVAEEQAGRRSRNPLLRQL